MLVKFKSRPLRVRRSISILTQQTVRPRTAAIVWSDHETHIEPTEDPKHPLNRYPRTKDSSARGEAVRQFLNMAQAQLPRAGGGPRELAGRFSRGSCASSATAG
jgi:hypothetical protein